MPPTFPHCLLILGLLLPCEAANGGPSTERPSAGPLPKHPFIRVSAEELVATAPSENLFLCPMNVTDDVDLSSWPSEEVTIDGTLCMDYDELMEVDKRGDFLKCLTEVTNATTHALDKLGIDASIIDGTLLGWQRHDKNHIPWDVDADLTIMLSHCRRAFNEHATQQHKNMAALLKDHLPTDSYYRVAGIIYGDGSELDPDEWTGCENREFRIIHDYKDVSCHADVFQTLQSDEPGGEDCASCPGYDEDLVTVCRDVDDTCGLYDDYFPMRWDEQDGGDVKIPHRVDVALKSYFGSLPWSLLNLREVPMNYEFDGSLLVVGRSMMVNDTAGEPSSPSSLRGSHSVASEVELSRGTPEASAPTIEEDTSAEKIVAVNWPLSREVTTPYNFDTYTLSVLISMIGVSFLLFFLGYCFCRRSRTAVSSADNEAPNEGNSFLNLINVVKGE
ncbi:hypothetical protein FOL46_005317 [Perkinsus olseni]|uniref:LicD/FKTN/FKRP nucleotidyltransferase domain-containing protein n=1 Tax=Perkinsus olseni TaxID=32597 RepID=A0A7J6LSY3_PEROL|nr:hypothetical protein FOL46_005317 [Perkinsus olseni]